MPDKTEVIKVFVANLPDRTDRKEHILSQFKDKGEFNVTIIDPVKESRPAKSLWETIKCIIKSKLNESDDFFIFCEDDHQFTENYNPEDLYRHIRKAISESADMLLGGVSWFQTPVPVSENIFWVEKFSGLQFTIIFKKFFTTILRSAFNETDVADYRLSDLTERKFIIHPFVSVQRDFGYSDVTHSNNKRGFVADLFQKSNKAFELLSRIYALHSTVGNNKSESAADYNTVTIPTYVINLPERKDRLEHIRKEFYGKDEFGLTIVDACKHSIGAVGLWNSIKKIIHLAIENDDDVIIICEDDHIFTEHYTKEYLIRNILEAYHQGCDILCGGISGGFNHALFVSPNRIWINSFWGSQFVVLFKRLFPKILAEAFSESDCADDILSEISGNKMALFPFISVQKDFGYSDVTQDNNKTTGLVDSMFFTAQERLKKIEHFALKYEVINQSSEIIL